MTVSRSNIIYIVSVLATVLAISAYELLPVKSFPILPTNDYPVIVLIDSDDGGQSTYSFEGDEHNVWNCNIVRNDTRHFCSIGVGLTQDPADWTLGYDLSKYTQFEFDVGYTGPSKEIRVSMRNYDPEIGNSEDYNSPHYIRTIFQKEYLTHKLVFDLTEFQVADWWIKMFAVKREKSKPKFDRVTSVYIDFLDPQPGEHQFTFKSVRFLGPYITKEHWYLGIIAIWLSVITIMVIARIRALHIAAQKDKRRLQELQTNNSVLQAQKELYKDLALLDTLTGVFNRKGFSDILNSEDFAPLENHKSCLVLIDLDHFKRINDTKGHSVGDLVLTSVGDLLKSNTRQGDVVARWGGEEFILFCPNTSVEDGYKFGEKIRLEIASLRFDNHLKLRVTASIGIASFDAERPFEESFNNADEALYKAKNIGRNCCVVFDSTTSKLVQIG